MIRKIPDIKIILVEVFFGVTDHRLENRSAENPKVKLFKERNSGSCGADFAEICNDTVITQINKVKTSQTG